MSDEPNKDQIAGNIDSASETELPEEALDEVAGGLAGDLHPKPTVDRKLMVNAGGGWDPIY